MFSHIMVGANDLEASKAFYDATFGVLGHKKCIQDAKGRYFYLTRQGVFAIGKPIDNQPATFANGGTIGFVASDPEMVDAWHAAGVANGGMTCEDPPGERTDGFGSRLYLAYLRDPSGNKLCVTFICPKDSD